MVHFMKVTIKVSFPIDQQYNFISGVFIIHWACVVGTTVSGKKQRLTIRSGRALALLVVAIDGAIIALADMTGMG